MSKSKKEPLPPFGTLVRVAESPEEDEKGCVRIKSIKKSPSKSSQGEDDVQEENGVLFWVNKSGFPIDNKTWDRMWDHVAKIHPDGYDMVRKVRNHGDLQQIPMISAPLNFPATMPVPDRLEKIQNYMRTLQYNHTGTQFFEIRKNRPISGLLECAKDMIKESLPIKCLEAVILGIFMTNGFLGVERFPISFKSVFGGNVHRHVVLGIYYAGRYGTIGMSRREELMYKPMIFKSLTDLVFDYERSYNKFMHEVKKVKIGLPVSHDPHSYEFINWKFWDDSVLGVVFTLPDCQSTDFNRARYSHRTLKALSLTMTKLTQKEASRELEVMAKEIRSKAKINTLTQEMSHFTQTKSKSWITPQPPSPRKMLSSTDVPSAYKETPAQSSLKQASKLYRSHTVVNANPESTNTKRKSFDSDYQLRI